MQEENVFKKYIFNTVVYRNALMYTEDQIWTGLYFDW